MNRDRLARLFPGCTFRSRRSKNRKESTSSTSAAASLAADILHEVEALLSRQALQELDLEARETALRQCVLPLAGASRNAGSTGTSPATPGHTCLAPVGYTPATPAAASSVLGACWASSRKKSAAREKGILKGLRKELGSLFVREADGPAADRWYRGLSTIHGLTGSAALRHYNVMHHMLGKAAQRWSHETGIGRNQADLVDVVRPDGRRERFLSAGEIHRLKQALDTKLIRKGLNDANGRSRPPRSRCGRRRENRSCQQRLQHDPQRAGIGRALNAQAAARRVEFEKPSGARGAAWPRAER